MGAGDEEALQEVLVAGGRPGLAAAAALLGPVSAHRVPLHVAGVRDGDDHLLLGDEVLGGEVRRLPLDLRPALVREELPHLAQLAHDHLQEHLLRGEDLLEADDGALDLGQLLQDLLPLQAGQALQLHLQDVAGLDLGERKPLHELVARGVAVGRLLDELDDLVDVVERDLQAEQDVLPLARLAQLVAGAPGDHVPPVGDEPLQELLQVEGAGLAAVDDA